jgi:hypothetical protein
LPKKSFKVLHWQTLGWGTVNFFTESQSQTKLVELEAAEKTFLQMQVSFLCAEHEG